MFIDQFKLKKKSVFTRMMYYIWKLKPKDFTHICPFFWISILNLFLILPAFIVNCIASGIYWVDDMLTKYFSKKKTIRYEREEMKLEEFINSKEIQNSYIQRYALAKYTNFKGCFSGDNTILYKIYASRWIHSAAASEFKQRVDLYLNELYNKVYEVERLKINKENLNKLRINKVVKVAKPIGFILLIGIALLSIFYAAYGTYKLFIFLSTVSWNKVLPVAGIAILIIAGVIMLGLLIYYIINNIKVKIPCSVIKALKKISQPFIWLFKGIYKLFLIIFQMIKSNCPAISWQD